MGHGGLFGKQVISDTGLDMLDTPGKTRQNSFEKPCRIAVVYGNGCRGVFRTCWWTTCRCRVTTTGRRPTCNAMRCLTVSDCVKMLKNRQFENVGCNG